ncbi:DUF3054 domain-containing protein [Georgenia wangjunii]|uniref:DUF3054 domain-containing protein n=1 Tax=Georgenia wangjunii TaxID=3117730 RepID=UPI002F26DB9C
MHPGAVVALDVVCVAVFIAVGQASHAGDGAATHPLLAVAPFLGALVLAHLVVRRGRERVWPGGVVVWLVTWGGGMAVRAFVNDGVAPAFLAVGLGALGVLLLGWRAVAALVRRSGAR